MKISLYRSSIARKDTGFTLVELIVTIAIMTVIMAGVMANTRVHERRVALRNTTEQVALMVRQAQVFSVGVRETHAGSEDFSSGYGVYLSMSTPDRVTLFVDLNDNDMYDATGSCGGAGNECVEQYELPTGFTVSDLCGRPTESSPEVCGLGELTVTFSVGRHEATVWGAGATQYAFGKIVLASRMGETETVHISRSGLTYVE